MSAPSEEETEVGEQKLASISPAAPPPAHQMDADEEDDNVKQLKECSAVYLALQDCLVRTDRDWRSCQREVQALKACHARRNNATKK